MKGLGGAAFQLPGTLDTPAPPWQIWSKQVICSRVDSFFFSIVTKAVVFVFVFFFGYAGSLLSSSFLHGLSLVTVNRGASLVAAQGLLTAVASFVAEHRLSCLMACGILVLGPGIELTSPALAAALPTTGPPERSPQSQFQALRESGWQRCSSRESKR